MERLNPTYSAAFRQSGVTLTFGLIVAENLREDLLKVAATETKIRAQTIIAQREQEIEKAIGCYANFFQQAGYKSPLTGQFQKTKKAGLPTITPLVDLLFATEMSQGVLAGVQDRDKMEGELTFDLAQAGDVFPGMRSPVYCKVGEPVLRDSKGIIASYMQGPDARTKVSETTTNAAWFFFSAPGLPDEVFSSAMDFAEESLKQVSCIAEKVVLRATSI
jgi:DNA/RNA-binding domain of Phe-tRNA-synthetase-like protein